MSLNLAKIPDKGLRNLFKEKRKGGLSYDEVKDLIKNTYDHKKVTKNELKGLKYILRNAKLDQQSKDLLITFLKAPGRRRLKAIENLKFSRKAVKFVDKKMSIGAANKTWSSEEARICVRTIRQGGYFSIQEMAKKAISGGCGNCGEQAAIAFMYLVRKGLAPLDYMSLDGGDHAFVVIGRWKKGAANKPRKWGPYAVVCDPWMRHNGEWIVGSYYASGYFRKMYDLAHMPRSVARIEAKKED